MLKLNAWIGKWGRVSQFFPDICEQEYLKCDFAEASLREVCWRFYDYLMTYFMHFLHVFTGVLRLSMQPKHAQL